MSKCVKTGLILGGVLLVVFLLVPMVIGTVNHYDTSYYGMWNWGMPGPQMMNFFPGGWYLGIFMIVFWGLVIWGIVALVRYLGRTQKYNSIQSDSALDILKKRYARGEIDKQEYEDRKKDLE